MRYKVLMWDSITKENRVGEIDIPIHSFPVPLVLSDIILAIDGYTAMDRVTPRKLHHVSRHDFANCVVIKRKWEDGFETVDIVLYGQVTNE